VEQSEEIAQQIRAKMAAKYHFDVKDMNAFGIYNNSVEYKRIMNMLDGVSIFVFVIGLLTLIAGVVGVSNIMMIIVKERTKEIGIRKALGASPFSIVSLIIQESVFITFIAGYVGLLRYLKVEGDFFKDPDVDLSIAISAVVLIIIAGALAGFFPALKAAKVEPIHALREG
jgi:putative ABC transport system permease protein